MIWLLAALVLHPVVEDDAPLRVVATGTGEHEVVWELDGAMVATTRDGEAASVAAATGPHELTARTAHEGPWQVLVRPEPTVEGAMYVPAWTARSPGVERQGAPTADTPAWLVPAAILAAAAAVALWPERT